MKKDSFGKYIEYLVPVFDEEYVLKRYNNNWRRLHGLPVLRGITKFRWGFENET